MKYLTMSYVNLLLTIYYLGILKNEVIVGLDEM
jgi:hypothetical protein